MTLTIITIIPLALFLELVLVLVPVQVLVLARLVNCVPPTTTPVLRLPCAGSNSQRAIRTAAKFG